LESGTGFSLSAYVRLSLCLPVCLLAYLNKSSAVAEMGDRGHNRHGQKEAGAAVSRRESWDPL